MMQRILNREFLKFILSGGIAAGMNFFSRMLFGLYLNYTTSIIFAHLVGMLTAYLLFKYIVFSTSENSTPKQLSYFVLINSLAVGCILLISLFFYHVVLARMTDTFWSESISHFVGIAATTLTSYFGHKYLTFR